MTRAYKPDPTQVEKGKCDGCGKHMCLCDLFACYDPPNAPKVYCRECYAKHMVEKER